MAYFPEDPIYELKLERLDEAARDERERGKRQWREAVARMEREGRLPLANPGSIPDWEHKVRTGEADWGDIYRYYTAEVPIMPEWWSTTTHLQTSPFKTLSFWRKAW